MPVHRFKSLTVLVHMASQRQVEEKKAALKANLKGGASGGGSSGAGQKHQQHGSSKRMMSRMLHSFKLFGGDVEAGQPREILEKDSKGEDCPLCLATVGLRCLRTALPVLALHLRLFGSSRAVLNLISLYWPAVLQLGWVGRLSY